MLLPIPTILLILLILSKNILNIISFPTPLSPHRDEEKIELLPLLGIVLVAEEAPEEGRL